MTHSYQHWPVLPTWEDLRFPAQGVNPVGSPAPPTLTANGLLSFSGSTDNVVAGVIQMPHSWVPETKIIPHIHLVVPASNAGKNSRWKFEYNRADLSGHFENAIGTYTTLGTAVTVPNPADTTLHLLVGFGDLTMVGYTASSMLNWKLSRLANSDVLDDDTGDWYLLEFDVHYLVGRSGTRSLY